MSQMSTTSDIHTGSLLGGRYRISERIAAGGMATVYSGHDEILGREVAVKLMHPTLATDPGFVERFRREAQNAARLNHPNIVMVYDCGEEHGTLFIVMELIEGTSLRELLGRFGRLDPDTVRHVVGGVASALDHAHMKGLVHRDVKPENVLLTSDGRVKVVDFGVAKALAEDGARITGEMAVGTVSYIAPEQLTGSDVDARADVYALGVMTYEMLTGHPPFSGDTPAAVAAARLGMSVPSPGAGAEIDGAVSKATARSPKDRFDTAGEFARSLGEGAGPTHMHETMHVERPVAPISPGTTVLSLQAPPARRSRRRFIPRQRRREPAPARVRTKRRRWPWAILLVLLAAGGSAAAYVSSFRPVEVPRATNMSVASATRVLSAADLEVGRTVTEHHDTVPEDAVIRTEPAVGSEVRIGSEVHLVVSKGPELFDVPSVTGKGIEEAKEMIAGAGFRIGEVTEAHHDTVPKDAVISAEPAPGDRVRKGTAVDLVASKGPELIKVPDVVGKSPDDAEKAIRGAGFTYASIKDWSDNVPEGQIIRSNPGAGRLAAKNSKVTVAISLGPKPFPMPDLVGMSLGEAKDKIASLGLVVGNEYPVPGSRGDKDTVQGQNPTAGTEVRKGAKADVYYAS